MQLLSSSCPAAILLSIDKTENEKFFDERQFKAHAESQVFGAKACLYAVLPVKSISL